MPTIFSSTFVLASAFKKALLRSSAVASPFFILSANFFKNKNNGTYLDIGCFHPYMYSNTCLLHKKGWSGINIDINQTSIDLFNIVRPNDTNICTAINDKKKEYILNPGDKIEVKAKQIHSEKTRNSGAKILIGKKNL